MTGGSTHYLLLCPISSSSSSSSRLSAAVKRMCVWCALPCPSYTAAPWRAPAESSG